MTVSPSSRPAWLGLPVGSVQQRQASLPEPLRALYRRLLAEFRTPRPTSRGTRA